MRHKLRPYDRVATIVEMDPRESGPSNVITLATRSTLPVVTQRKPGSEGLGIAAGVAVIGLLGAVTFANMSHTPQQNAAKSAAIQPVVPTSIPVVDLAPPVPPEAITPPQAAYVLPAPSPSPAGLPASNPFANATMLFDASDLPAPSPEAGSTLGALAVASGSQPIGGPNDDFAQRVGGIGGSTSVATAGVNPQTTVIQGTLIPAVLETAIDTDVPGFVRAVVSADVRSFDGSRVMVPHSSRLIGQYKSGMQAGQKRAYIIWSRLIRPDGVSVNIGSPAVSFGGETGLAGEVNNHFFERFGSAMLLSVVGGLSAIGSGGSSVIIGGQAQSAAAAAVGQTGQIGPSVRVRQGEPIRIFTARDLDFSRVVTQ